MTGKIDSLALKVSLSSDIEELGTAKNDVERAAEC